MRAVFDTNIVVSALVFGAELAWLRTAWVKRQLVPVTCDPTVEELVRVLAYPKFRLQQAKRSILLSDYLPGADHVGAPQRIPAWASACRDRDDWIFIALAAEAQVPLVTGDRAVAGLRGAVPIDVVEARELRQLIGL